MFSYEDEHLLSTCLVKKSPAGSQKINFRVFFFFFLVLSLFPFFLLPFSHPNLQKNEPHTHTLSKNINKWTVDRYSQLFD